MLKIRVRLNRLSGDRLLWRRSGRRLTERLGSRIWGSIGTRLWSRLWSRLAEKALVDRRRERNT
jgi:hypothetical protein